MDSITNSGANIRHLVLSRVLGRRNSADWKLEQNEECANLIHAAGRMMSWLAAANSVESSIGNIEEEGTSDQDKFVIDLIDGKSHTEAVRIVAEIGMEALGCQKAIALTYWSPEDIG